MDPVIFQKNLLKWFNRYGRDLPWRHIKPERRGKDPYAIWISEIMLQQTQVSRVIDFYMRFIHRFPDVQSLAKATWEEVLEYWRGLGYYRRARHLHQTAQIIVQEFEGTFPDDTDQLRKLPGIGPYTAAAIASFAFGRDVVAFDTNLRRVFMRFLGDWWTELGPRQQQAHLNTLIPKSKGAFFNHALMDIGATLCFSRNPLCKKCPLRSQCNFFQILSSSISYAPVQGNFPRLVLADKSSLKYEKSCQKIVKVAAGVVVRDGKILISRRPKHVEFGGFWEFPGGKLQDGEDERACLKRELQEELGIEVSVRPAFYVTRLQQSREMFSGRHVTYFDKKKHKTGQDGGQIVQISFHRCSLLLGEPKALQVQEFRWVAPEELSDYEFPPANKAVIEILLKKKAMFRV